MPRENCTDLRSLRAARAGAGAPKRGVGSPIALLLLVAACGGTPAAGPSIDAEGVCLKARELRQDGRHLLEQGFAGRAAPLLERADRDCSTDASRRELAEVWVALGLDHLAIETYRRYGAQGDTAARRHARDAIAGLHQRPPARSDAAPDARARAWQLYLAASARDADPARALRELGESYALWPHPLTIVQQGLAHRRAGREAVARTTYARALALAEATRRERARPRRIRQTIDVTAAAFHPAGRRLATATRDGGVELWDFDRLEVARVFAHPATRALVFSASGAKLATASTRRGRGLVRLWDTATGTMAHQFELTTAVNALVFAADGKLLVVAGADGVVRLYRTDTGELDFDWEFERGASVVALSPTSSRLAVAGDRFVQVIAVDEPSAPKVFSVHGAPITALAFDPTGAMVASGASDGSVRLSDAATGAEVAAHGGHRAAVVAVGVRADSRHLVSLASDATAQLWSLAGGGDTLAISMRDAGRVLAIDPALRMVITVTDRGIVEWDVDRGRVARVLEGRASPLRALAVDRSGRYVVAGSDDGSIRRWDLEAGTFTLMEGHKGPVHALAFSDSGKWLVSGGADSTVRVWEMRTGREFKAFDERRGAAVAVGFDPRARVVAARFVGARDQPGGKSGGTLAWELLSSQEIAVPPTIALAASADLRARVGPLEVRGSRDGSMEIWRKDRFVAELYAARDGTWLVTAADGRVDGSEGAQALVYWQTGDVQLPGFVGWQRQHADRLLGSLFQR